MDLQVSIEKNEINIIHQNIMISISSNPSNIPLNHLLLYTKNRQLNGIGIDNHQPSVDFDTLITISCDFDFPLADYGEFFYQQLTDAKLTIAREFPAKKIPQNYINQLDDFYESVATILTAFGYPMKKIKKAPAKAQHRWRKEISTVEFFIDYNEAKGTAIWQKRKELKLLAGATLKKEPPLNKDGSLGFAAKFTQSLRAEHAKQIKNFTTTEDIIFKSVNEIGNFLYFAGTNSWLILKDVNGKTIDDYTLVK
ncbi:hypothetical protein [Enterococcus sp. AZ103]|uniref:hypothetical protein n=1 Tax=Enterococcus sp. AZ103 TaxID=2774628 RepID=UPI003F26E393